jgi:hypothetical protein
MDLDEIELLVEDAILNKGAGKMTSAYEALMDAAVMVRCGMCAPQEERRIIEAAARLVREFYKP